MRTAILPGTSPKVFANAECRECRKLFTMKEPADWDDYVLWLNGMPLKDAFPYLNVYDQEILRSSETGDFICVACNSEE